MASINALSFEQRLRQETVSAMRDLMLDSAARLKKVDPNEADFDPQSAKEALKAGVWIIPDYIRAVRVLKARGVDFTKEDQQWLPSQKALETLFWGHASTTCFQRAKDVRSESSNLRFVSKGNVSASAALEAAGTSAPVLTDGGGAVQIAFHRAVRAVLGEEVYNRTFQGAVAIGPNLEEDRLLNEYVCAHVRGGDGPKKKEPIVQAGDWVYYKNHPFYAVQKTFGTVPGSHMIYGGKKNLQGQAVEQGHYLGLGQKKSVTREEIREFHVREFNRNDDLDDLQDLISESDLKKQEEQINNSIIVATVQGELPKNWESLLERHQRGVNMQISEDELPLFPATSVQLDAVALEKLMPKPV